MYQYNEQEKQQLTQRAMQFKGQVSRYSQGQLDADLFQQLRLRNGLYKQKLAHMLRVAIPYGCMNSAQLRKLADIADQFDHGYGHFTTRQNIQFNWPELIDVPKILLELATVNMHAIQTSGSCIRNISSDHLAGIAVDEIADPRPWCEMIRNWANLHPEFNWLPRKFKFAVTGATTDRALIQLHDIGLKIVKEDASGSYFDVYVGGGMGRTPMIAKRIKANLHGDDLLATLQAIIRVYNQYGRRDHRYRSRIKILVHDLGAAEFTQRVDQALLDNAAHAPRLDHDKLAALKQAFALRRPAPAPAIDARELPVNDAAYTRWLKYNTLPQRDNNARIVMVSLKSASAAPGDITAEQMRRLADLAQRYSLSEIRASHSQNLVLPHVQTADLYTLWRGLQAQNLATPNIGTLSDMIACPGFDFCTLANTTTLDIAAQITQHFSDLSKLHNLGAITLKISGCMNACAHHHAGNIGVLGVDKKGEQWYQLTLGGRVDNGHGGGAAIGARLGPAIAKKNLTSAISTIVDVYLERRATNEDFIDCVERLGVAPFKERVYANH